MTTTGLEKIVRDSYQLPEYATIFNVANATGAGASRYADCIRLGLWPSRGIDLVGFEFKTSRSDWLRELANPAKAESIFRYCDYWVLLTGDDGVAKIDEIPKAWGYSTIKGGRIKTVKEWPKLSPEPLSRKFLAALLRRAKEGSTDAEELEAKYRAGICEGERRRIAMADYELKDARETLKKWEEFSKASGIEISRYTYNAGKIGEAVKMITNDNPADRLRFLLTQLESLKVSTERALAEFEKKTD